MLVYNVVSICGVCLQVSLLSTSRDGRTCLVTAWRVLHDVLLGSQLDVNSNK